MKSLFIFTNDLRVRDSRTLWKAFQSSSRVSVIYVFDTDVFNKLEFERNSMRVSIVIEALSEINQFIKINVFKDELCNTVEKLLDRYRFDAVYMSFPHTWKLREKVRRLRRICSRYGVRFRVVFDNVLSDYKKISKSHNFSSFYREWLRNIDTNTVDIPNFDKYYVLDEPDLVEFINKYRLKTTNYLWRISDLRNRLTSFDFKNYSRTRDYPGLDGTSKLSPLISLGVLSIREIYLKTRSLSQEFIRQLAWREYYYYLGYIYPWMKELELKPRMRNIKWRNNEDYYRVFTEGKTGYPIVDAGIRQLKKENWVHNRVRLIIASFLVKDLHIDWRKGAEFFRNYLVDYDEVLNIGNWQWASSVGVDPLPLRVFNPIKQAKKYDPDCIYIKKYIPELAEYSCTELLDPLKHRIKEYYEPIVNHYIAIEEFKLLIST